MGDRTTGKKLAKVTKDTQRAEWVIRKTYQDRPIDCIHVPMFDRNAPPHSSRKLRWRKASKEPNLGQLPARRLDPDLRGNFERQQRSVQDHVVQQGISDVPPIEAPDVVGSLVVHLLAPGGGVPGIDALPLGDPPGPVPDL